MNKKELGELVTRYAVANAEKKAIVEEVKDLGDELKCELEEIEDRTFKANGFIATLTYRKGKKLDLEKVEKLLGGAIPASCYIDTETAVLNVKADQKENKPRLAVVKAVAPSAAVVAA